MEGSHICVVSNYLPRYDRTSAHLRIFNILKIFLDLGLKVTFFYSLETDDDKKYIESYNNNIDFQFYRRSIDDDVLVEKTVESNYVWITSIWDVPDFVWSIKLVEKIRLRCPSVKIIADTMDFHCKRFERQFEITKVEGLKRAALQLLDLEKEMYEISDAVAVVTETEKDDIHHTLKINESIFVIPNIHETFQRTVEYHNTKHYCYLGNFEFSPNKDAVLHFIDHVFHRIYKNIPDAEFHILGNKSEKITLKKQRKNVKLLGFVKDLEPALMQYRVFVGFILYGSGMKGKIGNAGSVGLPIVTTSIGAEGMPLIDGDNCYIADNANSFYEKCVKLYKDEILWKNFSVKSQWAIQNAYGRNKVTGKILYLLNNI